MIPRQLEPEVMDDPDEARAYDQMDHTAVNQQFVEDLLAAGAVGPQVLDLGTGTARIPIALCARLDECLVTASDAAASMLDVARRNVAASALQHRIRLHSGDAKALDFPDSQFDCVISNSLLHHLPKPGAAVLEMVRVVKPQGRLFVRDLLRPASAAEVQNLVALHAADEPAENQQLLRQSLLAALTLPEIQELVLQAGFGPETVQVTSDRHWTWTAVKP